MVVVVIGMQSDEGTGIATRLSLATFNFCSMVEKVQTREEQDSRKILFEVVTYER